MVLCQDTGVMLLGEPLNNLDMRYSVQMMHHLRRAATELGRTSVLGVRDVNFAGHYDDHICAVKDGAIAGFGPRTHVLTDEVRTRGFDTPVRVIDGPSGPLAVYY